MLLCSIICMKINFFNSVIPNIRMPELVRECFGTPCPQQVGASKSAYNPENPIIPQILIQTISNAGNPSTISTVSKLTVITLPINLTMYWGSSVRFGSLMMPLRLSVLTRYWSITHSKAERVPRR